MQNNTSLKREHGNGFFGILGRSRAIRKIFSAIKKVAAGSDSTVLILGESGTGKELVARAIHDTGPLRSQPFVEINCSTLPDNLLESELFGFEKGAFTDAKQTKKGLLEMADGGTFFMDEIADLDIRLQVKLLKVLEEKTFRRIGGTRNIQVTMRIMAATNRNLEDKIREGRFREDLFYRLNVLPIHLPPLRDRGSDVILLAERFLETFNERYSKKIEGFSENAKELFQTYLWPGNIRELKNAIERVVLFSSATVITPKELELGSGHVLPVEDFESVGTKGKFYIEIPREGISLADVEKSVIEKALALSGGNQCKTARFLKISRETLRYRLKKHRLPV